MKKSILLLLFVIFPIFILNAEIIPKPIIEGDKNSKVKILVYESLTCSYCASFHEKIYPRLKSEFIDKSLVFIEFKSFPLDLAALSASKLAHCNESSNRKVLSLLFKNQNEWIKGENIDELNSNLIKVLKNNNITLNFDECLNNENLEKFVLEERIEGSSKFKVNSTPTIIINNKRFEKSLTYKNLKKAIEKLL